MKKDYMKILFMQTHTILYLSLNTEMAYHINQQQVYHTLDKHNNIHHNLNI